MVQAQLIKWAIILAVVLGGAGTIWWKIHSLTAQRDRAIVDLMDMTGKFNRSQHDLEEATRSKAELTAATQRAEKARVAVQAQLLASLSKLRQQKPPSECKAAIDWAVEQKQDMDWSKQ